MLVEYAVGKMVQYSGQTFAKKIMKRAVERLAVGLVVGVAKDATRSLKPKNKRKNQFA